LASDSPPPVPWPVDEWLETGFCIHHRRGLPPVPRSRVARVRRRYRDGPSRKYDEYGGRVKEAADLLLAAPKDGRSPRAGRGGPTDRIRGWRPRRANDR